MKKKKNLPETPEEILSYVTPHRMEVWKKKAEEGLATYFFIMSRHHRHIAWCSHCRHFVRLRASRHRREDVCPHCGSVGEQILIRAEATNERLGTMEIAADGTHIIQARAAFNADLPQDVQMFVEKFKAEKIKPIGIAG